MSNKLKKMLAIFLFMASLGSIVLLSSASPANAGSLRSETVCYDREKFSREIAPRTFQVFINKNDPWRRGIGWYVTSDHEVDVWIGKAGGRYCHSEIIDYHVALAPGSSVYIEMGDFRKANLARDLRTSFEPCGSSLGSVGCKVYKWATVYRLSWLCERRFDALRVWHGSKTPSSGKRCAYGSHH